MSDKNESRMKERFLFLERFLLARSDEKHPVTTISSSVPGREVDEKKGSSKHDGLPFL